LIAGWLLFFGAPFQLKNPNICDHAAPPVGMRWVCAAENPCDCHLEPATTGGPPGDSASNLPMPATCCLSCRIVFFVIPAYPEAARRGHKQGLVSASLVLRADGSVEDVRIQSGDPQLAPAVRSAFRQWRFAPGNRVESLPVSVDFELSENPARVAEGRSLLNSVVTARPLR